MVAKEIQTIEESYEDVLNGKRQRLPRGTLQDIHLVRRLVHYLIEEKLQWTDEEIRNNLTVRVFTKYKLRGLLSRVYNDSPYNAINDAYPGKFKPWEFISTPQGYWTEENAVDAVKWLIEEKLQWTDMDIRNRLSANTFGENGLEGMLIAAYAHSPYAAINAAYPSRFKPWELKKSPSQYWNARTAIEATKWLIEEKLKWRHVDVCAYLSTKSFVDHNLGGMLSQVYSDSPYKAIEATYPEQYKPWQLQKAPFRYWSQETAKNAVKWLIEEQLHWDEDQVKDHLNRTVFYKYGLGGMLTIIYGDNAFRAIDDAYPNRYRPTQFKTPPMCPM